MKGAFRAAFVVLVVFLVGALVPASTVHASDWVWGITPYFWGPSLQLGVKVDDRQVIDQRVDLPDLIDKLDFVFSIHFEGRKGKNGFFGDLYFADFGKDQKTFDLAASAPGQVVVDPGFEFTIVEAGGLYNPKGTGEGLTLLYGVRMFDFDLKIDADYQFDSGSREIRNYRASETLWDGLVGVRYIGRFADRWLYDLKADVSAGGTQLTWTALAGVGWMYGKDRQHAIVVGYRYMDIDLGESTRERVVTESEVEMAGFFLALEFGF